MPTAARLTAAIVFGALGVLFALTAAPLFSEGTQPTFWLPLNGGVGVLCGWIIAGKRAGRGTFASIGNGITVVIAMMFWVYFLMSFNDMIKQSMRNTYDGPIEAVIDIFTIMTEYAVKHATIELGMILAIGAVVGGLVTEYVGNRLP